MFEPWYATRSTASLIGLGPTPRFDNDEARGQWDAMVARAETDAPFLIWGSGVHAPAVCTNLDGSVTVATGDAVLLTVRPVETQAGRLDSETLALHICAAVNFTGNVDVSNQPPLETLLEELREHRSRQRRTEIDTWFHPTPKRKRVRRKSNGST
jgi:hypothetical protein